MVNSHLISVIHYYEFNLRYNEAVYVLKQPQDLAWQASALEGMAVAGILDSWSASHTSVRCIHHPYVQGSSY